MTAIAHPGKVYRNANPNRAKIAGPSSLTAPGHAGTMAILCGPCVYICPNRDPNTSPPRLTAHPLRGSTLESFAQVATWALAAGVENVWILPPGRLASNFHELASVSKMQADAGEGYTFHELTMRSQGQSHLAGVIAQRQRGGPLCTIWAPRALQDWGLDALPQDASPEDRAEDLAYAWLLASYALRVRLRFSPSYSGLLLLRRIASESKTDFKKPSERFAKLIEEARPRPLGWITPAREVPDPDAPVKVWAYDRNWSYVSSARVVPLGDPAQVVDFIPNRPGIYRITATAPTRWGPRPDPFQRGKLQNIWAWEPQMRLAQEHGWSIDVHEGYAWVGNGSTYDLRPWQGKMWDARNELTAMIDKRGVPAIVAKGMVSKIGRAALGRFKPRKGHMLVEQDTADDSDMTSIELDRSGRATGLVEVETALGRDDLHRPEWWYQIIASAAERGLWAAYRHAPLDGLAGWVDSLYAPSPRGLEGDGNKPGGWHLEVKGVTIPAGIAYGGNIGEFTHAVRQAAREQANG